MGLGYGGYDLDFIRNTPEKVFVYFYDLAVCSLH